MSLTDAETRATSTRVLRATRALVDLHGARKVTVSEIAARAGVGKGTIYLYWPSKEDLILALLAEEVIDSLDEAAAAIRRDVTHLRPSRLAVLLLRIRQRRPLVRTIVEDPDARRILAGREAAQHPFADATPMALAAHMIPVLRTGGLVRDDLDESAQAYALHAVMEGFAISADNPHAAIIAGAEDPEQVLADTVRILLEPVTLPPVPAWETVRTTSLEVVEDARTRLQRIVEPLGSP